MKRTSKRYVVTTSALNCYGYRVLTEGVDFSQYEKNPILLWMHQRAYGSSKDQILPLGRAVDIKRDGDEISCFLEFDETDEFAMQVYNKYENGTLNMLSLGAKPLAWSEEPHLMLEGQTGVTFTKSKVTDVSCVDMGGNDDACACKLYDANDKPIELADLTGEGMIRLFQSLQHTNNDDNMKLIQLTGGALNGILLALKLKDDATEVQVQEAVNNSIQLAATLTTENGTLKTEKETAEAKVTELQGKVDEQIKLAAAEKVNALVDGAVTDKKILPAEKETYIKLANVDFASTKAILDGRPAAQTIADTVNSKKSISDAAINLSYDQMDKAGTLIKLKAENFDLFKAKYFDQFNKEYTGAQ